MFLDIVLDIEENYQYKSHDSWVDVDDRLNKMLKGGSDIG